MAMSVPPNPVDRLALEEASIIQLDDDVVLDEAPSSEITEPDDVHLARCGRLGLPVTRT